jgi:hypothetical protein
MPCIVQWFAEHPPGVQAANPSPTRARTAPCRWTV